MPVKILPDTCYLPIRKLFVGNGLPGWDFEYPVSPQQTVNFGVQKLRFQAPIGGRGGWSPLPSIDTLKLKKTNWI